jgi:outer membrane protein assembly factor BamB
MNDDQFAERLRSAEGPATPDPGYVDRLYLELAAELEHPSARGRRHASARRGARPRLGLLAAALLLLALALAAAIVGGELLLRPSVVTPSAGWPGFKGDAARRGEGVDGPVGHPVLRWRFQADGAVPENVSVAGDLAYASSDDGVLHALDVVTGAERWHFVADHPPLKGPLVDHGVVYVFDGVGVLHAFDARTGDPRWRSTIPVSGPTDSTVGGGEVFVGSDDGSLVAMDAATGTERWRVPISLRGPTHAPAYIEDHVVVAAAGGGFVRVDARDGAIAWRFDTGESATGTAVIADGIAYLGASATSGETGTLWAVDATTGTKRWHIGQAIFSPAVSDGVAYSGSLALGVVAIDTSDGHQLWTFPVQGPARPLAVANGVVYVPAGAERRVYALDSVTGSELWRFDVDADIWCCVAVADGAAFVGTQLGGVYAIAGTGDGPRPKE